MLVTVIIWGSILSIGIGVGVACGLSINNSLEPIERLYGELDTARDEITALKRENHELRHELGCEPDEDVPVSKEGEWWKDGDPNPLGECSH